LVYHRLGIGEHHQQRDAEEELNEYLSQAISGRNIDWLRTQHMNRLLLTFRKADMETKVTTTTATTTTTTAAAAAAAAAAAPFTKMTSVA